MGDIDDAKTASEELQARWLKFGAIGRFLAVALLQDHPLPLSLGTILMKFFCEEKISYRDIRQLDPDFYKYRIAMILEEGGLAAATAALDEPLTFITAPTELVPTSVPLKENGENIQVTEENKMEYITLLSEARLCNGRRHELQFFIAGFHEVIPPDLLKEARVSPMELALLISGIHDVNVAEWKAHAECSGDPVVINWFWELVEGFDEEQKGKLLQFSTGTSRLPAGGFKDMVPRFKIQVTQEPVDHLPNSHTCFNMICLPEYATKQELADKLTMALAAGSDAGFGVA